MRTGSSNLSLFEDEVLFNFPLLPSIIFIQGGNYLGNQNCPVPFQMDIGYSALLTFQAVCTVRGSWTDPGCHLDASSRALAPTWPSSSSAHESRDLSASCTAHPNGTWGTLWAAFQGGCQNRKQVVSHSLNHLLLLTPVLARAQA